MVLWFLLSFFFRIFLRGMVGTTDSSEEVDDSAQELNTVGGMLHMDSFLSEFIPIEEKNELASACVEDFDFACVEPYARACVKVEVRIAGGAITLRSSNSGVTLFMTDLADDDVLRAGRTEHRSSISGVTFATVFEIELDAV